jgi:hypothetical protein
MTVLRLPPAEGRVNILVLLMIYWFLFSAFDVRLLLSDTVVAGGDTVGYYYMAYYLHNSLLPRGEIVGWSPGWFAGFPMFQYYFPLVFVASAVAGYIIPLNVSFKLATIMGILLLPVCAFLGLRLSGLRFPTPVMGAALTLPYLFLNHYSMWGGNIMSTFAGEFSYSWSVSLMVLFLGFTCYDIKGQRYWYVGSFAYSLILLTHGITSIFSCLATLYLAAAGGRKLLLRSIGYLARLYALAFLIAGFYLLPLLATGGYSTPHIWLFPSKLDELANMLAPDYLRPFILLAALGAYLGLKAGERWASYTVFSVAVACVLFFVSYPVSVLHIPFASHLMMVKFLPYIYLFIFLLGAYALGRLSAAAELGALAPLLVFFAAVWWTASVNAPVTGWFDWNYSGMEAKGMWGSFKEVSDFLRSSPVPGRVEFEWTGASQNNGLGSSRSIEALPVFSGRGMLKGTQFQGGYNSPFAYMIECEYSKPCPCPLWPVSGGCPAYNLSMAKAHLKMFGVKYLVAESKGLKEGLDADGGFRLVKKTDYFSVYELTNHDGRLAYPAENEPVLAKTGDWRRTSYLWFNTSRLEDVPVVYAGSAPGGFADRFVQTVDADADGLDGVRKVPVGWNCSVSEAVGDDSVHIRTDCLGRPVIVKYSYHPNWRVEGADHIFLASPGFMLVYPQREDVYLRYGRGLPDYLGIVMSLFGLACLTALSARALRTRSGVPGARRRRNRRY